ncbi:glycoside hydrolase family 2, partial [Blautia faecis]|nr:glycoside hydrolase family 2 [Blautia faecis]
KQYGYGKTNSEKELTDKIEKMYQEMVIPSINNGLCGCIYTQISDIENEINGLYTYDRKICKVNQQRMSELARKLYPYYEKKSGLS